MKQIDYDALQSKAIDWLRFPLIVCVVFIHSQGQPPLGKVVMDWSTYDSMMLYNALRILLATIVAEVAVPCFFTISGYYFFYHLKEWNNNVYKEKLWKRIYTLLIPYLIWNLIGFFYNISLFLFRDVPLSLTDILNAFLGTGNISPHIPADGPLWYVRDLMVLSILSPIIYYLIRRLKALYILFLFIVYISTICNSVPGLSIRGFLYFGLGAYFSINKQNMLYFFRRYTWIITFFANLLLIALFYIKVFSSVEAKWFYNLFIFFYVVFCLMMAGVLTEKGIVKNNMFLSQRVFFIFVFHKLWFVEVPFNKLSEYLYASFSGNAWMSSIVFLAIPCLKIIISIGAFEILNRLFPRLLRLSIGNRVARK